MNPLALRHAKVISVLIFFIAKSTVIIFPGSGQNIFIPAFKRLSIDDAFGDAHFLMIFGVLANLRVNKKEYQVPADGCYAIDKQSTLVHEGKAASSSLEVVNGEICKLQPEGKTEYRLGVELVARGNLGEVSSRRRLEPFQVCLVCRCCMAPGGSSCVNMPCCFGIDCQLPNKPFGVCAFVPKFCNCTSCAV